MFMSEFHHKTFIRPEAGLTDTLRYVLSGFDVCLFFEFFGSFFHMISYILNRPWTTYIVSTVSSRLERSGIFWNGS